MKGRQFSLMAVLLVLVAMVTSAQTNVIQMKLDREGNGSGTLSYATRIVPHENNVIELEDFATQPIMLNNIHAQTKNATK